MVDYDGLPYDRNRGWSQLAGVASSSMALPRARLSLTTTAARTARLMVMTVRMASFNHFRAWNVEPSIVRSTRMPFS